VADSQGGDSQSNEDTNLAPAEAAGEGDSNELKHQDAATRSRKRSTAEMLEQTKQDLAKLTAKDVSKLTHQSCSSMMLRWRK
jgi:hypothetical protein